MCDFSSDIPKAAAPPPPPPVGAKLRLGDPLDTAMGTNADGTPIRRKSGLASLRIDRNEGTGLNLPVS